MSYLWLKAFHLIAVVAWMAGLFYLPRLFVYHRGTPPGSESSQIFKVMERRLLMAIMAPAMAASWLVGLALAWLTGVLSEWPLWFAIKAMAALTLTGFHFWLGSFVDCFARDERPRNARFFRMINEVPTILLVVIVFMAVLKPV